MVTSNNNNNNNIVVVKKLNLFLILIHLHYGTIGIIITMIVTL